MSSKTLEACVIFIESCCLQVAELEAEFEKLGNQKAQQARFLRSQQDLKAKMEEKAARAEAGDEEEEEGFYYVISAIFISPEPEGVETVAPCFHPFLASLMPNHENCMNL